MLFRETVVVYYENYTKFLLKSVGMMHSLLIYFHVFRGHAVA
jgi:hypothetical protein